jgi:hypothetical protein
MSVLISDTEVSIRLMRDEPGDYQVMSKWLSDPRMLEFYERRDHPLALEQIQSEYAPHSRRTRRYPLPDHPAICADRLRAVLFRWRGIALLLRSSGG